MSAKTNTATMILASLALAVPAAAQWHIHDVQLGSFYYTTVVPVVVPPPGRERFQFDVELSEIFWRLDGCLDETATPVLLTCGWPPSIECIHEHTDPCVDVYFKELAAAWARWYERSRGVGR